MHNVRLINTFTCISLFQLCGAVVLGVGIWMAIDRNFMNEIIGTDLYIASLYMILIFGGIIFFISFLGCCGAITENKFLLWAVSCPYR